MINVEVDVEAVAVVFDDETSVTVNLTLKKIIRDDEIYGFLLNKLWLKVQQHR
jgi:hypothetical protein